MSPGNQGVFQLLKEVTFRRILAFFSLWEGYFSWKMLTTEFIMLSPCFFIAEYILSCQNSARNSRTTFVSIMMILH